MFCRHFFRVALSLIFYLISTCPFQRVRFLFLFSLWNINLSGDFNNIKKLKEKLSQEILIISCQIDEEQGNALWVATLMY